MAHTHSSCPHWRVTPFATTISVKYLVSTSGRTLHKQAGKKVMLMADGFLMPSWDDGAIITTTLEVVRKSPSNRTQRRGGQKLQGRAVQRCLWWRQAYRYRQEYHLRNAAPLAQDRWGSPMHFTSLTSLGYFVEASTRCRQFVPPAHATGIPQCSYCR